MIDYNIYNMIPTKYYAYTLFIFYIFVLTCIVIFGSSRAALVSNQGSRAPDCHFGQIQSAGG